MSFPVGCTFRRDFNREFPGVELPSLAFLSSVEDESGYCMSTRDCIKQDELSLRQEKRRLELKLAQIKFSLDWLETNKEELLRVLETDGDRVYENPDEERICYENTPLTSRKSSTERPPMPVPRHDNSRLDDTGVTMHGTPKIKQELEQVLRQMGTDTRTTTNQKTNRMTRTPSAGNFQPTGTPPSNSSMVSDGLSSDANVSGCFLFCVRMNSDSGYSAEREKLSYRKNEKLDVIEEWATPMQQFYRVRNSSGQLGVVPKQMCQPSFSDHSVLWGRPWFHQNTTRHQADSLLGSCSEGSYLIRDSTKEIGNFVLSLKTRNSVGHYVITTNTKGYKFCKKDFISLDALIEYFRKFTLDKGTSLVSSPLKV